MWDRFQQIMMKMGFNDVWPSEIAASLTDDDLLLTIKLSNIKAEAIRNMAIYLLKNQAPHRY